MRPRRFRQIRRVGNAWRAPHAAVNVSIGSQGVDELDEDPDNEHLVNRYFIYLSQIQPKMFFSILIVRTMHLLVSALSTSTGKSIQFWLQRVLNAKSIDYFLSLFVDVQIIDILYSPH